LHAFDQYLIDFFFAHLGNPLTLGVLRGGLL
jgi:hypothetical protein